MNSSGTSTPPSNHIRKRRAHKRSRNGCVTCKHRHIRCDELKPVCTNCLTRGGDCGYPDAGARSGSGSGPGGGGPTDIRTTSRAKQLRLLMFPTSPVDPFDALPVKMPHRSMELFHHFAQYRIFSRTPVPKSQDTACVGIVFGGPGVFCAGLLMTALHFSWMSPSGSLAHTDMEETYLHHKLEAMRHVNELVADPQLCTSDDCIGLIAALAMAESGMGDIAAAEAHLGGLCTLVNMRRPEEWQHRFWGILQRIILVTGSFIAASKEPERGGGYGQFMTAISDGSVDGSSPQTPSYPQPTGPVFSTAPFVATRLSPFYMGSTPDIEACKADVEGEVLINALRRLSSLTGADDSVFTAAGSRSHSPSPRPAHSETGPAASSAAGTGTYNSPSANEEADEPPGTSLYSSVRDATAALLSDTDAYIISLLFKPHPLYPRAHKTTQVEEGLDDNGPSHNTFTQQPRPHPVNPWTATTMNNTPPSPQTYPYASLPADKFPSSSRAWASAAYLYLHVVLEPLWLIDREDSGDESGEKPELYPDHTTISAPTKPGNNSPPKHHHQQQGPNRKGMDNKYLLRLLLDTLRADTTHTEQAMRTGAYSKELWIWKVVVGAYTLFSLDNNEGDVVWVDSGGFQGTKTDHTRGTIPQSQPGGGGIKRARICPEGARVAERMAVRLGNRNRSRPPRQPPSQKTPSSPSFTSGQHQGHGTTTPIIQEHVRQTGTNTSSSSPQSSPSPSYSSSSSSPPSPAASTQNEEPPVPTKSTAQPQPQPQPQPPRQNTETEEAERLERNYIPSLQAFFTSSMRSWSRATRITSWQTVKENISKIAWPEHLRDAEVVTRKLWEDAITVTLAGASV